MAKENVVCIYSGHLPLYMWPHQFNRHELGQTPGDGEGQGSLAFFSCEEFYTTWWLNNKAYMMEYYSAIKE